MSLIYYLYFSLDIIFQFSYILSLTIQYCFNGLINAYVFKSVNKCSLINKMTTNIDNVLECLTIEIFVENSKNIIITCVYRMPGSCLNTFNGKFDSMFGSINNNKVHIICVHGSTY